MKSTKNKKPMSSQARFIFGAGIGVAISIPIFGGVDSAPVKFLLMVAFAAIMGYAQVIAGKDTAGARKFTRWAIVGGILAMAVGIVAFLLYS
jgi:hypothetical protein